MAKRITKKERKKRAIRATLIAVICVALIGLAVGVLRDRVSSQVSSGKAEVLSATVTRGSIRTTVSGTGNLTDEDVQTLLLHAGVKLENTLAEAGDKVEAGQMLATVDMSTVLSAMTDIQNQINDLDDEIGEASGDELAASVQSALAGRVMKLYGAKGDDVSTVMYENGALALLSLDGYLAVQVQAGALTDGQTVTVTTDQGKTIKGTVETVQGDTAVVLIADSAADYEQSVTVTDSEGTELGSGQLYIHQQMKITGVAGTINKVQVSEKQKISAGKTLFTLSNTSFSANYTGLLEEREDLEQQLQRLITVYRDGGVLAPIDGTVSAVGESESQSSTGQMSYSGFGGTQSTAATAQEQTLFSICPGTQMTVSISVDETDILSLELGQTASVTVDALGDTSVQGTVTKIDTTATSSGGVTVYTATVTFDKTERMLSGMSASVSVVIQGVEDALLIPSDALTQTSATSYVYTSYDAQTGELGGMIEVTTGLNNGSYVEITGGLNENDTVYYQESQESSVGFGAMGGFGGMGGGNMPGFGGSGGNIPNFGGGGSGGNMPDFSGSGRPSGNFGGRG